MDKEIYVSYLDSDEYIKWNGKPSLRIRFNMLYFIGSLFITALKFNRNCIIIADINVPEKVYKMITE